MRFLSIVCLVSLLLSMAMLHSMQANAANTPCISPTSFPTVTNTPIVPTADQSSLVLNEVLPSPHSGGNCAYQNSDNALQNAWIELYNLLDQPLDLYAGRTCVDTGPNTIQACLALGSTIPAHGFFTFFPYMISNSFRLTGISTLRLLLASTPVDQVNIPTLPDDISYARLPDGTGKWQPDPLPTINSSNSIMFSPSPTPTHLSKKHSNKAKTTTQVKKKRTRSTGSASTDAIIRDVATDNSSQTQDNSDKQPHWHGLQFPSPLASPSAIDSADNILATPSLASTPTENIPQKLLFSLLGIVGLLSLWLGWKHFFKKRRESG